jgi:hypothetical protein
MSGVDGFNDFLTPRIRVMQIIAFSLVLGPAIMLAVVVAIRAGRNAAPPPPTPLVSYVLLGFAAMMIMPFAIVPNMAAAGARQRLIQGRVLNDDDIHAILCNVYQTRMIIGSAMLEGAAMAQFIAYLVEGRMVSLVVGGLLLAGLVLQFPTRGRVETWIERQLERTK